MPAPDIVPSVHTVGPLTVTAEVPLKVPPLRSSVVAFTPPVLLKVKPPPVRFKAVTANAWVLLNTAVPPEKLPVLAALKLPATVDVPLTKLTEPAVLMLLLAPSV